MEASKTKQITAEELRKWNSRHNAHVAFAGKVYDVSAFIAKHPGGCDQLMLGAGRDITQLFQSYHKLGTEKLIGEKCKYVGELIENEMPVFPPSSEGDFFSTVKRRVHQYFRTNGLDPKVNIPTFCYYFILAVATPIFWCLSISVYASSLFLAVFFAFVSGLLCTLLTFTVGHDGNHYAITHKPWVWKMSTTLCGCVIGISSLVWTYTHTYGHHIYTNIDKFDPDTVTADKGADFWRIKPFQSWFPSYRFQHIYMPILYLIVAIKMKVQDFQAIFTMKRVYIPVNPLSTYELVAFSTLKTVHFLYRFLIPLLYVPLPSLILLNLIADMIMGLLIGLIGQLNHITTNVSWSLPKTDSKQEHDKSWAEMQIASTLNYATDSWLWTILTGGLNHQVTHHLFPGMLQTYYPKITPIVEETCAEFGIPYHSLPTAWEAVQCHLGHLKVMGSTP